MSKQNLCRKAEFDASCKKLEILNLSELTTRKNPLSTTQSAGKASTCFIKSNPKDDSLGIINSLINFFVSIEEYENSYKNE